MSRLHVLAGSFMDSVLILLVLGLAFPRVVWAGSAIQTDWSRGGGAPGPVSEPGDRFDSAQEIAWRSIPGQITLTGTPLGTPTEHAVESTHKINDIRVGDLDGDGDLDLVAAHMDAPGTINWWRNDGGNSTIWTRLDIDWSFSGARGVEIADIDRDGRQDVLGTGFSAEVAWWRNTGDELFPWQKRVISSTFSGGHRLYAFDVDGDGDQDLAGSAYSADDITLWINMGGSPVAWTEQQLNASFDGAVEVHGGDIDGDGAPDVIGAAYDGDKIAWWRNGGGDPIVWTEQTVATGFDGAHSLRAADIDGDGDLDIAGVAYYARDVTWWRNDGGNPIVWTAQLINGNYDGAATVRLADLDGDGDVDVVAAGQDPGRLAWFENADGLGTSWTVRNIKSSYSGAWPTDLADLDRDGDIDVVCGAFYAGMIRWWDITQYRTSGWLRGSILDLGESAALLILNWDADVPAGSRLAFRMRASADPADLGSWSSEVTTSGIVPGVAGRYAQYEAICSTDDPAVAPILQEVAVVYTVASGAEDVERRDESPVVLVATNPSRGQAELEIRLSKPAQVILDLYTVEGRWISRPVAGPVPSGSHHARIGGLPGGVYLYRATIAGEERTGRFVLLR